MEKIDFRKEGVPFTQVANFVLNDPKISLAAKGLYAYLYSKPIDWDFSEQRIAIESKNSRTSVRTAIQELEENGYLTRIKQSNGRMLYSVTFRVKPKSQNDTQATEPKSQNATVAKCHSGKLIPISNKEYIQINNLKNKEYAETSSADRKLSEKGNTDVQSISYKTPKMASNRRVNPKDDQTPMTTEEFVKWAKLSEQRHIQIIADYADEIKPKFTTKGQWHVFMTRCLRAARDLSPFTDDQIANAFSKIYSNMKTPQNPKGYITKWTLETLLDFMHE